MPYSYNKAYRPPLFLFNKHLETIYPALFRKIDFIEPQRERVELEDGDFIDLDLYLQKSSKLLILNHGLEGSSNKPYMLGMAKKFYKNGYDVISWNFRGCSGEINRLPRFYHSGETTDLRTLVNSKQQNYRKIMLVGFSLGANMMLKYIGEESNRINSKIKCAVAFSVPMHLESSCRKIMSKENYVYQKRFLNNLKDKILAKETLLKSIIDIDKAMRSKNLMDFDDNVTAPLHGFKNAHEYYEKSSSLKYLDQIDIPTLIVNSENDPMLSKKCFPNEVVENNTKVHFEKWKNGGHVGFYEKGDFYSSESRAYNFSEKWIS